MTTERDAGWRIDAYGVERWWDGYRWHEARDRSHDVVTRRRPHAPAPAPIVVAPQTSRPYSTPSYASQAAAVQRYEAQQAFGYGSPPQPVAAPKELWLAYLLAILLSTFGIHRMYLGRVGSGIAMLAITLVSAPLLLLFGIGLLGYLAVSIWWVVDLFLIPGMVRDANARRMRGARWGATV